MAHSILTAIGGDRPGLVEEVSDFIYRRGGNIEDSRMVNLRGQFAMMVLVGGGEAVMGRIDEESGDLARQSGLRVEVVSAGAAATATATAFPLRFTGHGLDQPGLVHRVAQLLRGMKVNIESLDTHLRPAPYTGAPLFEMELLLSVPQTTPLRQLRQDIAKVCDELNIDWDLEPA